MLNIKPWSGTLHYTQIIVADGAEFGQQVAVLGFGGRAAGSDDAVVIGPAVLADVHVG